MLFLSLCLLPLASCALTERLGLAQEPLPSFHDRDCNDPLDSDDFQKYIDNVLGELHTPGMAIAIIHGNNTYSKGFGRSHLNPNKAVTPHTLFFAGSTTKSFTAAAASKLVYSNDSRYADITWSTPLNHLIRDDFVLQDEYATNHVTLTDALSHRTGMPRHDKSWINGDASFREQVRQMRHLPMHNEIRTQWEYCNLMFTSVAHAVQTVTGLGLREIFKGWFWEPLGMRETFLDLPDALDSKGEDAVARGHLWDKSSQAFVQVPWSDIPPLDGAGGVITNVLDYAHWVRQFLHPEYYSHPLSPEIVKDMTAANMPIPPQDWRPFTSSVYGLGLETEVYRGQKLSGHGGSIAGYMATMKWIPNLDWGLVILQNSYSLAWAVTELKLVDDFLDSKGVSPWSPEGRFNMAVKTKRMEMKGDQRLKPENARKEAYPDAPDETLLAPVLPLEAYEGTYTHPAYHNFTFSMMSSSAEALPSVRLSLRAAPSARSYLNLTATLHHVSGEDWWVHEMQGPGFFMTDEVLKAKFEVGVGGKVEAMWYQAEGAMEQLARFAKIT